MSYFPLVPASTNATHLLWGSGRWIPAVRHGDAWKFWNGRDAADWLDATRPRFLDGLDCGDPDDVET